MFIAVILEGDNSSLYHSILQDHCASIAIANKDTILESLIYLAGNQYQKSLNSLLSPFTKDNQVVFHDGVSFLGWEIAVNSIF